VKEQATQSFTALLLGPAASFRRQFLLLLLFLLPLTLLVAWRVPVTYPEGDFVNNLLDAARTGHVGSTFTPDAYPYLAGTAYRLAGVRGFLALQAALYLLLGCVMLWLVRALAGSTRAAVLAVLVICLDPDLILSIAKVWDTGLTCLLLIGFATLSLASARRPSATVLLALATVWGLGMAVRPNFALLGIALAYLLPAVRVKAWPLKLAATVAWGCGTLLLANLLAHGSFYVAQNGPYNFFAGANPYTRAALLHLYNGESSVPLALSALGIHVGTQADATYDLALRSTYMHHALRFIASHPLRWLGLCSLKMLTLLRPDLKAHALLTVAGAVKVLTCLCVPLWLTTLGLTTLGLTTLGLTTLGLTTRGAAKKLEPADRLMLVLAACYILPFLLTNADPRFRPPLDALVLAHAASLIARRFPGIAAQAGVLPLPGQAQSLAAGVR
jgi:4-amino-4-deoxy-L-arabinose transferase-like glycosyltransferase